MGLLKMNVTTQAVGIAASVGALAGFHTAFVFYEPDHISLETIEKRKVEARKTARADCEGNTEERSRHFSWMKLQFSGC